MWDFEYSNNPIRWYHIIVSLVILGVVWVFLDRWSELRQLEENFDSQCIGWYERQFGVGGGRSSAE